MPDVMVVKEVEEDAVPIVLPRLGRRFLGSNRESCLLTRPGGTALSPASPLTLISYISDPAPLTNASLLCLCSSPRFSSPWSRSRG